MKSYLYIHESDQERFLNLVAQGYWSEAYEMYCRMIDSIILSLKEQTFGIVDIEDLKGIRVVKGGIDGV